MKRFRTIDANGDGSISADELKGIFMNLDPEKWTEKSINDLFEAADVNKDGRIQADEFVDWVLKGHAFDMSLPSGEQLWRGFRKTLEKVPEAVPSDVDAEERVRALRETLRLPQIPAGLDGRVSMAQVKRVRGGEHDYRLTRLASEGDGSILLLLQESGSDGDLQHVYRLTAGNELTAFGAGGPEAFQAAWDRTPVELKLVALFSLAKGGGETVMVPDAANAIAEALKQSVITAEQSAALKNACDREALVFIIGMMIKAEMGDADEITAELRALNGMSLADLQELVGNTEVDEMAYEGMLFFGGGSPVSVNWLAGKVPSA